MNPSPQEERRPDPDNEKEVLSRPHEILTTSSASTISDSTSLQAIEPLSLQHLTISPLQLALCPTTVVQRVHQIAQHLVRYLEMKEITESHLPEVDFRSDQYGVSTYDHIINTLTIFRSHESDGYALAELLSDWLHDQCLKLRTQESDPTTYQEEVDLQLRWAHFRRYVGRELARMACVDSDVAALFDPTRRRTPDRDINITPKQQEARFSTKLLALSTLGRNVSLTELTRSLESVRSDFLNQTKSLQELPPEELSRAISTAIVQSREQATSAFERFFAKDTIVPPLDENSPRVDTIALTLKLHQETSQDLQKVRDFCDTVCSSLLTQLSGDQGDGNSLDTALRRTTPLEAWQSWLEWNISLTKIFQEKFLGLRTLLSFEVEKYHPEAFGYAMANSWLGKAARLRTDYANIFRLSVREIQSDYFYANIGPHTFPSVLFCTFSLCEGLLLLANPLYKAILKSCLA